MKMKKVYTTEAPEPGGHYSQAIIANGLVFISGQLPVVPGTGERISGPIEEQTLQALKNIEAIAVAAGSDKLKIVKVTVYITDISLWGDVNKAYSQFFGTHKPARAIIPVRDLHHGLKVEIDAVAII